MKNQVKSMSLRERYQTVLQRMQDRIDDASYRWHWNGCDDARKEYYQLIFEVCEIKQVIKDEEDSTTNSTIGNSSNRS